MDWDDFEMEMIDGGAEDVEKDEEEVMITTAFEDFGSLSHKLMNLELKQKVQNYKEFQTIQKK
jgi:transcriptional/translational regulatory protein YebC/TACO1